MTVIDIITGLLATVGSLFVLFAAVGVVRLPDLYTRISAATKAATLGIGLLLVCAAVFFGDIGMSTRVAAIILFVTLTSPVGAHMLGRSSYFLGIKMWNRSVVDDLKGKYNQKTYELSSEDKKEEDSNS